MIEQFMSKVSCLLMGKPCKPTRPSSNEVRSKLRDRSSKVEAKTYELREHRKVVATGDFLEDEMFLRRNRQEKQRRD